MVSDSGCEIVEPLTFSLSRKRSASVALECETKMHTEGPPKLVQSPSGAAKFAIQTLEECMQSRAPPPREGTPLQNRPPAEELAMEIEDSSPSLDCTRKSGSRQNGRKSRQNGRKYLETRENIQVEVSELEHDLPGPEDADMTIRSLAENARDEEGYSECVLLNIPRGNGGARGLKWLMQHALLQRHVKGGRLQAKT